MRTSLKTYQKCNPCTFHNEIHKYKLQPYIISTEIHMYMYGREGNSGENKKNTTTVCDVILIHCSRTLKVVTHKKCNGMCD